MMQFYLTHTRHGKKIAYQDKEAEADKKAGWKEVTEDEFYGRTGDPVPKAKRGRPAKEALNDSPTE